MPYKLLPKSYKVYLSLCFVFAILLSIMPRKAKFDYDYKKGAVWPYQTLVAQFDFPILKTSEQLRKEEQEISSVSYPYFRFNNSVSVKILEQVADSDLGELSHYKADIMEYLSACYEKGVISSLSAEENFEIILLQRDKRVSKTLVSNVYTIAEIQRGLEDIAAAKGIQNPVQAVSSSKIMDYIRPNLEFDEENTELFHSAAGSRVSVTQGFVRSGQIIVSNQELITAEIQQMLDSYKAEYESSVGYGNSAWILFTGNALLSLLMCMILFFAILYTNPQIFDTYNKFLYLLFVITMSSVVAILIERYNPRLLYMVPFSLASLYLLAFFKKRVILPVYIISLIPLLVFGHNGMELFLMNIVAGIVNMYIYQFWSRGWRQFISAMVVFLCMLVTYLSFRLISDIHSVSYTWRIIYMLIGSFLSVAAYPLIYLFEKFFGLLSNARLTELCDTNNNKLLVKLATVAPGTFQHSLQVMNMCDAAAKSVDADVLLVRTGALYHDIGKIMNPNCFIENERHGVNYHSSLTPLESAKNIIRHVSDGLSLADKHNLPDEIKDFIETHHGTTCVAYFYNKYISEGGNPDDKHLFCYNGKKPKTKEHIIMMLCDTLEAASRTLKDNSQTTFDEFVEKVVSHKMEEGQFDEAEITLKEINIVKSVLKQYLSQIYHERIVYPSAKA